MTDAEDVEELLEERPDLRSAMEVVLDASEPWTFDDVDVDSGSFGELVSRGVVVESGDGYRVANRRAVEQGLREDQSVDTDDTPSAARVLDTLRASVSTSWQRQTSRRTVAALLSILLFVAAVRLASFTSVFQSGEVVLSGNDPYAYRHTVERLLESETLLSDLPFSTRRGEPLFVATVWWIASLMGGTTEATGTVMAWYPVSTAAASAALLYGFVRVLTDDVRVALATVALFAIVPGHAFRTSLGFADHHAFDYVWLVLTATATAVTTSAVGEGRLGRLWIAPGTLGVALGVAGQTLAWEAGPLLLGALGVYLFIDSVAVRESDRSPLVRSFPVLCGIAVGAGIVWAVHSAYGWHTTLVAGAPFLLFGGGVSTVLIEEVGYRVRLSYRSLIGLQLLGSVGGLTLFTVLFPSCGRGSSRRLTNSCSGLPRSPKPVGCSDSRSGGYCCSDSYSCSRCRT